MAVVGGCLSGIWGLQIRVEDIFGFESCSAEGFTRLEEFRDQRLWTFGFGIEFTCTVTTITSYSQTFCVFELHKCKFQGFGLRKNLSSTCRRKYDPEMVLYQQCFEASLRVLCHD